MAVLECPDDRFAGVLDHRSYRLRSRHSTYGASQARKMGRTAKSMKFFFRSTPIFNGKEPLKVFSWLRKFVKACCSGSCPHCQRGLTPSENPAQGADRYTRVTTRTPGSVGAKRTKTIEATKTQR